MSGRLRRAASPPCPAEGVLVVEVRAAPLEVTLPKLEFSSFKVRRPFWVQPL